MIFDSKTKTYIPNTPAEVKAEIGDSKETEFRPRVKLSKWDNECNFSLGLAHTEAELSRASTVQAENKIIWAVDNKEAHFYELADGFELEVVLKERPASNTINLTLNVPKAVKFYYQRPLNEIMQVGKNGVASVTATHAYDKNGRIIAERPEKVVGSYAVYHDSKRGDYSKLGGENYKTGKFCHIYRPKAVDAGGSEVWCDLAIDGQSQTATITVPQKWLDGAKYPVTVDPTFGYEQIGSTAYENIAVGAWWIFEASTARLGLKVVAEENVTVTDLHMACAGTDENHDPAEISNVHTKGLINEAYPDPLGPHSGIDVVEDVCNYDDLPSWVTVSGFNTELTPGNYILSFVIKPVDVPDEYTIRLYFDTGVAGAISYPDFNDHDYENPSDPWSMFNYWEVGWAFSIYATYEPAGGPQTEEGGIGVVTEAVVGGSGQVKEVDRFVIERSANGGAYAPLVEIPLDASVLIYDDSDLTDGASYTYRIKQIIDNVESMWSYTAPVLYEASSIAPIITITNYTKERISNHPDHDVSVVTFHSDQDLAEWEARADGEGHGEGILVGIGGTETADEDIEFEVYDEELTQGDKTYRINVYGKNVGGVWTPYDE